MPSPTARLAGRVRQWAACFRQCVSKPHYQCITTVLLGLLLCLMVSPDSNVIAAANARGVATAYTFDSLDQPSAVTDPLDWLTAVTDWRGHTTTFAYDPNGNLTTQSYPNATSHETTTTADRQPMSDDAAGGCVASPVDGLSHSFPADTTVATPHGPVSIARVRVGDTVLAEDPATGVNAPETVTAVHDDGVEPLMAVAFSDGSAVTETLGHPFWVDSGAHLARPGWLSANALRVGDRVRTARGLDVVVTGLQHYAGTARVYTLTVARDHTFFVGTARVLVHNCGRVPYGSTDLSRAVQEARVASRDRLGNYAAGRLEDGTIIIGRSNTDFHAEENLIQQAGNRRIVDLYSERAPCAAKCADLVAGMNPTWSWEWNEVDLADTKAIRADTNAALRKAVQDLFRR